MPELSPFGFPPEIRVPELVEGLPFPDSASMGFWAYMLHCNAGRFYVGHTDDLERRIAQHETGAIPGFTLRFRPVKLVWSQEFTTRDEAKLAERRIKGWRREKKLALIREDWERISQLAKCKGSPSTSSGPRGFGNV